MHCLSHRHVCCCQSVHLLVCCPPHVSLVYTHRALNVPLQRRAAQLVKAVLCSCSATVLDGMTDIFAAVYGVGKVAVTISGQVMHAACDDVDSLLCSDDIVTAMSLTEGLIVYTSKFGLSQELRDLLPRAVRCVGMYMGGVGGGS